MRLGVIRLEGERLSVTGDSLLLLVLVLQRIAKVVVRLGKIGLKVNGFVIMRNRFV